MSERDVGRTLFRRVPDRHRGLRNSFGEQVVHEDLDLNVRRGEILGVVGGSGTGKSVLMRSIIGLQMPDEGRDRGVRRKHVLDAERTTRICATAGACCSRAARCSPR
jgi:ABC-type transporter Mla maintaining outer membrane lipid asymmetry ATPase subunit MlaF